MPQKYTTPEFAAAIRKKNNGAYTDVPDDALVSAYIRKNPVYADWVDTTSSASPEQIKANVTAAGPFRGATPKIPEITDITAAPFEPTTPSGIPARVTNPLEGAELLYPSASAMAPRGKSTPDNPVVKVGESYIGLQDALRDQVMGKLPGYVGPGQVPSPITAELEHRTAARTDAETAAMMQQFAAGPGKNLPPELKYALKGSPGVDPGVSGFFKGAQHGATAFSPAFDPNIAPTEKAGYDAGAATIPTAGMLLSGIAAAQWEAPPVAAAGALAPAVYMAAAEANRMAREKQAGNVIAPAEFVGNLSREATKGLGYGVSAAAAPMFNKLPGPIQPLAQGLLGVGLTAAPMALDQYLSGKKVDLTDPEIQKWMMVGGGGGLLGGMVHASQAALALKNAAANPAGRAGLIDDIISRIKTDELHPPVGSQGNPAVEGALPPKPPTPTGLDIRDPNTPVAVPPGADVTYKGQKVTGYRKGAPMGAAETPSMLEITLEDGTTATVKPTDLNTVTYTEPTGKTSTVDEGKAWKKAGQSGEVSADLLSTMGGAGAGALVGAATGDSGVDRLKNTLIGMGLGATVPAALQRSMKNEAGIIGRRTLTGPAAEGNVFYSRLGRAVEALPEKSTARDMLARLKKQPFNPAEDEYVGVSKWLEGMDPAAKVTKEEVRRFFGENQLRVSEVSRRNTTIDEINAAHRAVKEAEANQDKYMLEALARDPELMAAKQLVFNPEMRKGANKEQLQAAFNKVNSARANILKNDPKARELDWIVSQARHVVIDLDRNNPQWRNYSFPGEGKGGENYRELALKWEATPQQKAKAFGVSPEELARRRETEFDTVGEDLNDPTVWQRAANDVGELPSDHGERAAGEGVIGRVRYHDRVDPATGKKIRTIDEVQSDWAKNLRAQGKPLSAEETAEIVRLEKRLDELRIKRNELRQTQEWLQDGADAENFSSDHLEKLWEANHNELVANSTEQDEILNNPLLSRSTSSVPDMPFREGGMDWDQLTMKRVLRDAVDNDIDIIQWTTGAQQSARWEKVTKFRVNKGVFEGEVRDPETGAMQWRPLGKNQLAELEAKPNLKAALEERKNSLSPNIEVYGKGALSQEGHLQAYDQRLPNWLSKYAKRFGAGPVGKGEIEYPGPTDVSGVYPDEAALAAAKAKVGVSQKEAVHSFEITPAMRDAIKGGQELGIGRADLLTMLGSTGAGALLGVTSADKDKGDNPWLRTAVGAAAGAVGGAGIVRLGRKPTPGPIAADSLDPIVREHLKPTELPDVPWTTAVKEIAKTTSNLMREVFVPEHALKALGFQEIPDLIARYNDARLEIFGKISSGLQKTLAPINSSKQFRDLSDLVRMTRDLELAQQGKRLPHWSQGYDLPTIQRNLENLQQLVDGPTRVAYSNLREWLHDLGMITTEHGRLSRATIEANPNYFPDVVLQYYQDPYNSVLSQKSPLGKYKKSGYQYKHEGGERETLNDLVKVMVRYSTKVLSDEAKDKLVEAVFQKEGMLGPVIEQLRQMHANRYEGIPESLQRIMIKKSLRDLFDPQAQDALRRAGQPVHNLMSAYRDFDFFQYGKNFDILPKPIAARLREHFNEPHPFLDKMNRLTSAMKGGILRWIWGAFASGNFLGDNARLLLFDDSYNPLKIMSTELGPAKTGALVGGAAGAVAGSLGAREQDQEGWKGLISGGLAGAAAGAGVGKMVGPDASAARAAWLHHRVKPADVRNLSALDQSLWHTAELAKDVNIGAGAATGEMGTYLRKDPKMLKLQGLKSPVAAAILSAPAWIANKQDVAREYLETVPRLTKFMLELERGKTPELAGKITRKVMIDYADLSPIEQKWLRGLFIPFYTFYARNFQSLVPGLAEGPTGSYVEGAKMAGRAWGRYAGATLALWAFNNYVMGGVEKNLDERAKNQPHIVLPWGKKDDEYIYLGFQDPASMVLRQVGAAGAPERISSVIRGRTTIGDEVSTGLKQARESMVGLVNPLVTEAIGQSLPTPQDVRTGKNITDPVNTPTQNLAARGRHVLENMPVTFSFTRAQSEGEGAVDWTKNFLKKFIGPGNIVQKRDQWTDKMAREDEAFGKGMTTATRSTQQEKRALEAPLAKVLVTTEPKEIPALINGWLNNGFGPELTAQLQKASDEYVRNNNLPGSLVLQEADRDTQISLVYQALKTAAGHNRALRPYAQQMGQMINTPKTPGKKAYFIIKELEKLQK